MKLLLLCNKSPWPPLEGGPIAMNAMVSGLLDAGHTVKVLAINSNKYGVAAEDIPEDYRRKTGFESVYIDLSVRPWPAFLNLFTGESYHVERFISEDFRQTLTRILKEEEFDLVQFETLFTTPYLPLVRSLSGARLILRAHNIEHLIWQRIAEGSKNPLKKLYLKHLARTLRSYELATLKQLDGIVAITAKDAEYFREQAPGVPVAAIPYGISPGSFKQFIAGPGSKADRSLFHLGTMNWIPNQEGIRWFIRNVWPDVSARFPGISFHLAGREMPEWLYELNDPGIITDGEVPDAIQYMHRHAIMIVPLFSGSGIRIKIIEGMMAGKAIITTTIGAEGIECRNGEHILLRNDARGFAEAIESCLQSPQLIEKLGENARHLVQQEHNNAVLMQKITEFYRMLIR